MKSSKVAENITPFVELDESFATLATCVRNSGNFIKSCEPETTFTLSESELTL